VSAPEHVWEISFLMPNGDTRWFRTRRRMMFQGAVMQAIRSSFMSPYIDGTLLSIENVDMPESRVHLGAGS
jgi:hypothetical protein